MSRALRDDMPTTVEVPVLLTAKDISHLAGCSTTTIYRAVAAGIFPEPITGFLGKSTRWRAADYVAYIHRLKEMEPPFSHPDVLPHGAQAGKVLVSNVELKAFRRYAKRRTKLPRSI